MSVVWIAISGVVLKTRPLPLPRGKVVVALALVLAMRAAVIQSRTKGEEMQDNKFILMLA